MNAEGSGAARICLVTSAHVSNNPRLVKEADALVAAGHMVRVVALVLGDEGARHDQLLLPGRRWRFSPLDVRRRSIAPRWRWLSTGLRQRAVRTLGPSAPAALRDAACSRYLSELASAAIAEPATNEHRISAVFMRVYMVFGTPYMVIFAPV